MEERDMKIVGGPTMKDLAKENFRLSIENRQLKKKLERVIMEYQELARFCQEREVVSDGH